jgi:hypothetical protein
VDKIDKFKIKNQDLTDSFMPGRDKVFGAILGAAKQHAEQKGKRDQLRAMLEPEMAGGGNVVKALARAVKAVDVLPATERQANLDKLLQASKVPMRLYHGTVATEGGKGTEAIRSFKPSKEGALGSGVYLTPNTAKASRYSGIPNEEALAQLRESGGFPDQVITDLHSGNFREDVFGKQQGGNMLPVYAQIKNPLIIEGKGDPMVEALTKLGMDPSKAEKMVERAYDTKGYIGKEVESRARAAGYDGLMQYHDGELSEVVSYNPSAIKSAIGNEGTFDTTINDLSKKTGGAVIMKEGGGIGKNVGRGMAGLTRSKQDVNPKDLQAMFLELAAAQGVPFAEAGAEYLRGNIEDAKFAAGVDAALTAVPVVGMAAKPAYRAVKSGVKKAAPAAREVLHDALHSGMESGAIIDPRMSAIRAYHGTPVQGLSDLSPRKAIEVRDSVWFSDNPNVADQYRYPREYGEVLYDEPAGDLLTANLLFENPMIVDMSGDVGEAIRLGRLLNEAKTKGFDALVLKNVDDTIDSSKELGTSFAVWNPELIQLIERNNKKIKTKDTGLPAAPRDLAALGIGLPAASSLAGKDEDYAKGGAVIMKTGGEVHAANGLPLAFAQDKEDPDALQNWMRERQFGKVDIPAPYKVKPEEVTVARAMGTRAPEMSAKDKLRNLLQEGVKQGKKEIKTLGDPNAVTDLVNRGLIANNPVSGAIDLVNMGLEPFGLGSEMPIGGSAHVQKLMKDYGLTKQERPLLETGLALASPFAPSAAKKVGQLAKDTAPAAREVLHDALHSGMESGLIQGPAYVFIGPKAKTFDKKAAKQFEKMEAAGAPLNETWQEARTFRSPDQMLRQEVGDEPSRLKRERQYDLEVEFGDVKKRIAAEEDRLNELRQSGQISPEEFDAQMDRVVGPLLGARADIAMEYGKTGKMSGPVREHALKYPTLSKVMYHPELFKAYPSLKTVRAGYGVDKNLESIKGYFSPSQNRMYAESNYTPLTRNILLHEIQHAIQGIEGFGRGSNVSRSISEMLPPGMSENDLIDQLRRSIANMKNRQSEIRDIVGDNKNIYSNDLYKPLALEHINLTKTIEDSNKAIEDIIQQGNSHRIYLRSAGEAEARAAQKRWNMTPEERAATHPLESYDVPLDQLIVKR